MKHTKIKSVFRKILSIEFILLLIVTGVDVVMVSSISHAAASSSVVEKAYTKKINKLKTLKKYKKGLYTATVSSSKGSKTLLVTDTVFRSEGKNAVTADVYQYVNGKVVYICKLTSTGTSYPLSKKGTYLLSGYHHSSSRYKIVNGKAIVERLDDLYLNKKKCTYTKYSIKNGKQKKILEKKLSTSKAHQINYYSDEGTPIKFKKQ